MSDKEKLYSMVDAIINNEHEKAEVDFHGYLQGKMQNMVSNPQKQQPEEDLTIDDDLDL